MLIEETYSCSCGSKLQIETDTAASRDIMLKGWKREHRGARHKVEEPVVVIPEKKPRQIRRKPN
ncbi:hypothetical protein [Anaeroselena agilis]|uniref:Uncharacterized protein n=1 Tax=Anaeroselena agilis TaxID=3063788 RepID=A0ABU3P0K6_9FIRM|nr:hypothetical protein [Selenomonadales bacterium 4137-cl]